MPKSRKQKSVSVPLSVFMATSSARPAPSHGPSTPPPPLTNPWGPGSAHAEQVEARHKLAEASRLKQEKARLQEEQEALRKQEEEDRLAEQARAEQELEWIQNRVELLECYDEACDENPWKLCATIWPRGMRSKGLYNPKDKSQCVLFLLRHYKQIVRWFQGEFKDILFKQGQKVYSSENLEMVLAFLRQDQLKGRQIEKLELLMILYQFTDEDKAGVYIVNMEDQLSKWRSEQDPDRKMKIARDIVTDNY